MIIVGFIFDVIVVTSIVVRRSSSSELICVIGTSVTLNGGRARIGDGELIVMSEIFGLVMQAIG